MNSIKSEWPLVVFTTGAPLCAGAWVVLAALVLVGVDSHAVLLTMGANGVFLCALLVASLACSTLHLGRPVKALRAFSRLGNSTVSNEVFIGALFAVLSLLYLAVAHSMGDVADLRKVLLVLVTAFAVLFVVFQCLAYRMRTVPTWNSFAFAIEFAVVALLGGAILVGVMAAVGASLSLDLRLVLVAVAFFGCFAMLVAMGVQNAVVVRACDGLLLARERGEFVAAGIVRMSLVIVGVAVWGHALLMPDPSMPLSVAGGVIVLLGIVLGRCAFYRAYCNVGLPHA